MGLYDRDYMREPREPEPEPPQGGGWIAVIALVLVLAFLLRALL